MIFKHSFADIDGPPSPREKQKFQSPSSAFRFIT